MPGKVRKTLLEEVDQGNGSSERGHREKRYSRQRCWGLAAIKSMRCVRGKEFSEVRVQCMEW